MQVTILGSGTSHGVPMIGCRCHVCLSNKIKNRRFRPSILVSNGHRNLLVDTTPELRMQALSVGLDRVDAVLITHTHADHIMGLDDIRRFNDLADSAIPVYGTADNLADIRRIYPYIFMETQKGGGKPRLSLHELSDELEIIGLHILPYQVLHGRLPVTSYRFVNRAGDRQISAAYVTDVSQIPGETLAGLQGLDLLILDAVRYEPHPTHFGLYQALEVVEQLKPKRTLFTHLSHHFEHDAVNAVLPAGVELAYDGLRIEL